jgi:hypothetical protein
MKVDAAVTRQRERLAESIPFATMKYPMIRVTAGLTMATSTDFARENALRILKQLQRTSSKIARAVTPVWRLEHVSISVMSSIHHAFSSRSV